MKKINKLPLVALIALIASCGGGGGSPTTSTPPTSGGPVDEGDIVRDESGNIVFDGVELTMWAVTTGDDAATQDTIVAGFNELYDGMIKVTVEHKSRYELDAILQTTLDFNRDQAPELLLTHGARLYEYLENGWVQPIDTWAEVAGLVIDKDDYVSSLLESVTVDDRVYGLPLDVHSAMVVVRTDILEKNNLAIPTNFNELVSVCETAITLAQNGNLWIRGDNTEGATKTEWRKATTTQTYCPFPMSFGDMWVHEFLSYTVATQNGGTFVDDRGYPSFYSPETIKGLELLRGIVQPSDNTVNKLPLSTNFGADYDVGDAPLRSGNAIFKLQGPWAYQNDLASFDSILRDDGGSSNITTLPLSNLFALDTSKDYASKIKGEGHAFMLLDTVESETKKAASAIFADYMVNYSGIEWAKRGHLPALKSVENSSDYKEDPAYEAYIKNWGTCDDYVVIPPTPYYSIIDSHYKDAAMKVMARDMMNLSVDSILEEVYDEAIAYIELFA